jgi:DNA-binding response OmpR family regulator
MNIRVLYVEDDAGCVKLVERLLCRSGFIEFWSAPTAAAGLAVWERFGPDIVLVDLGLPSGADGFDFVRALRAAGYHGAVIALTARVYSDVEMRCASEGFDGFIAKPFPIVDFVSRVIGVLERVKVCA